MNRDELDVLVADVLGDHFARLRADLEARVDRRINEKAVPPFVPPGPWSAGRYGAGAVVRHRNGIFCARRDTAGEPGSDDAWLALLVGVEKVETTWAGNRTFVLNVHLSDGTINSSMHDFEVPLARGYWEADAIYDPADRVVRYGEWQAVKASRGVDPTTEEGAASWIKVSGKQARGVSFTLDDDGTMHEGGRPIGSLKPMVAELFAKLTNGGDHGGSR